MNRTAARHIVPALVAVALLAGCGDDSSDDTATTAASPGESVNAQVCEGYGDLQKAVEDLRSDPIDPSASAEEIQAKAAELSGKAATVKASLSRLSALSDGPVAAAVGEMNMKADELNAAYDDVTKVLDEKCASN